MPQTTSQAFTMNVTPVAALAFVDAAALPDAVEFQPYSHQLSVTGGTAPYTYAGSAGAFPAGITVSASGLISGTPSASGAFSFTVQVTDSGA
jgi:Putative Ig domain